MSQPPVDSILSFAQDLVRTPSRAHEDDPEKIITVIAGWAARKNLIFHTLHDENGKPVGGFFHHDSGRPGPVLCLDACVDTCGFGAPETWQHPPASGKIDNGLLHGRGAADSKIAVSLFCHLFAAVTQDGLGRGQLYVLLDADEHTGNFGGVKAFINKVPKLDAVFIGYPGDREIMTGARGFLRATITVHGRAAHSGSRAPAADNAVVRMARLIGMISSAQLPAAPEPLFPFGPKVTVTAARGGESFSQVPGKAEISVDLRLTPAFGQQSADAWLRDIIASFDKNHPASPATAISFTESWPAYALPAAHPAARALRESAERELGHPVALAVCGPSNIGNFLASKNIPALCGFGVGFQNLHAADEAARIDKIAPVYETYRRTIGSLCA